MFNIFREVPSQEPTSFNPPPPPQSGGRRFGKKLYAVVAVAAIVVVAVALMIPQGAATIPLSVDYVVGEKMVYDTSLTMTLQSSNLDSSSSVPAPNSVTMNALQTIEVIDFDGDNYSLNHTTTMNLLGKPMSVSVIEKMNKTGYSTYLLNLGNTQTQISGAGGLTGSSYLAQLLSKPEAKVGETITVPFPDIGSSEIDITGDITIKFNSVEDLVVPAGTYKAFRIDMTTKNVKMTYNFPDTGSSIISLDNLNMAMAIDMNAQVYMEYGTMRQLKTTMEADLSLQSSLLNMSSLMSMDMTLKEHIKP